MNTVHMGSERLVVRDGARAGFFCGGDDSTQYKEYGRSTNVAGYVTVPPGDERSTLASIVNGYPETDFAEKRMAGRRFWLSSTCIELQHCQSSLVSASAL